MDSNGARDLFASRGLTYEDINSGDIGVLYMLLNKHVKEANKNGEMSTDTMRMSEKIKGKYTTKGKLRECEFYLNSHYFTRREAITFDRNGFIGFAGWADDTNKKPIIDAFVEWLETL